MIGVGAYFKKILALFLKGYELKIIVLLIMSVIAGFLEFMGIALIFPLILLLLQKEDSVDAQFIPIFKEVPFLADNMVLIASLIIFAFVFKNIFMCINAYFQTSVLKNWQADMNLDIFKRYLYSSYESKLGIPAKYSIFQVNQLSNVVFSNFIFRILTLVSSGLILSVILGLLIYKFGIWALITGIFFLLSGFIQGKIFKSIGQKLSKQKIELMNIGNLRIFSALKNIKDIKICGKELYFNKLYGEYLKETAKVDTMVDFCNIIPQNCVELVIIASIIIMSFGVVNISQGDAEVLVASLGLLAAAIFRMAPVVNKIQVCLNFMNTSRPMVQEFFNAYEYYISISKDEKFSDKCFDFSDKLDIKNLSFAYGDKKVLQNITLSIKKGEFVGIIGGSGVGKTTFLDVLMGLLESYTGEILADNKSLTQENAKMWINSIGYVPQDVTTLPVSIAENIAFGIDKKNIDYDLLAKVIKQAQLDEYIAQLQNGIDTELTDLQGLSQGQKQRIGIARALYKNPEILFLDEITSALDVETENKITQCLNELKGEKTIIAIAHRLCTLKNCDRLFYFKTGNQVLSGSFEELIACDKDFERLVNLSTISSENS